MFLLSSAQTFFWVNNCVSIDLHFPFSPLSSIFLRAHPSAVFYTQGDGRSSCLQGHTQPLLHTAVQMLSTIPSWVHPISVLLLPHNEYCIKPETGALERDAHAPTLTCHSNKMHPVEHHWLWEHHFGKAEKEIMRACDSGTWSRQPSWGPAALKCGGGTPNPLTNVELLGVRAVPPLLAFALQKWSSKYHAFSSPWAWGRTDSLK